MRIAAILLGIVLALVLAGLVVAPRLLDVERFKAPIAAQLSERTGETVELVGPIALSLLPSPALTARDLRIANPPGAAVPYMVRLRALEVKLALLPLLTGRIEPRGVTLVEAEIDLERLPDGTANWRSAPAAAAAAGAPAAPASGETPEAAAIAALAHLVVQNGAVTWRGGGIERFEHINADTSIDPVSGQIAATGDLVARGAAVSFDLRSGLPGAGDMPLQLTVTTKPAARLLLDAVLTGPPGDRRISGKLKLASGDARGFLATLARVSLPPALAQPMTASADLAGSARDLALDHLALDFGPLHADGSLHLAAGPPAALSLSLSVAQIDLDRWPAPRQAALSPARPGLAWAALPGTAALVAAPRGLGGFALPAGLNASLDIGVDGMLWHGGIVRNARLKLALADGRLTLSRLAALLPGGSDLSLSGTAATTPEGVRAQAAIEVNADDLRSLCGWFGVTMDRIPPDRLRKATLSGRLALAGDRLDIDALDATLDATRLGGAATVLLRARPGIGLRLAADRFNLDAYLPPPAAAAPPAAPASTPAAPAPPAGAGLRSAVDLNLDARVQALTWHGQPMSDVHLAGTLENGEVTIRELGVGDLGGATANLSGVIDGIDDTTTGQLAFDMHGPELERVLRVVAPKLARGRHYGAFSLGGGMQYDRRTVTVDTDLQLLDGHAHVVGDIARANGALDLGVDLDHPSFAGLVRVFSPLYQPAQDPGAVKLSGRVSGEPQRFTLEHLALAIGHGTLAGTIGVDRSAARLRLDADLTAGDWAIDRLLSARRSAALEQHFARAAPMPGIVLAAARPAPAVPLWSAEPVDFSLLRRADLELKLAAHSLAYGAWRLDSPTLAASVQDGVLSLRQLTAKLLGGSLEASGDASGVAAPALQGRLALRDIDLKEALATAAGAGFVDGRFDVDAQLSAGGRSEAEMVAALAGTATLHSGGGSLAGVDLKAMNQRIAARSGDLASLLRSGAGGRTAFSALDGSFRIADGTARSDDLHLSAEGGDGRATLSLDLPQWILASRVEFRLAGLPEAPPLVMRLDGAIDAPRTVFDVNALEQYLARRTPTAKPARP